MLSWIIAMTIHSSSQVTPVVRVWERWERTFRADSPAPPETELTVEFVSPGGDKHVVRGFWDGDNVWKVRFMPDNAGTWRYRTTATADVLGLNRVTGSFRADPAQRPTGRSGSNALYHRGAVSVRENDHHFDYADETPFFWLADTCWNGPLLSSKEDWLEYLTARAAQRFTVIQFNLLAPWRTALTDAEGRTAYKGFEKIEISPAFFRRLDERIDAINAKGLVAAPVILWTLGDKEHSPGQLPESEAIRLAKYVVARYGGNHVLWILAGDENYSGEKAERWKRIGRAVFEGISHAPVTLHPQGMHWPFRAFEQEKWLGFFGYQSGHGDDAPTLKWIHTGPPAGDWARGAPRPYINLEPPYEDHVAYQSRKPHSAYNVRRAVWWSLLSTPIAGVTYGGHGIWSWQTVPGEPLNHAGTGVAKTWREALKLPGGDQMRVMMDILSAIEWKALRPAQRLLAAQPGGADPARFVAAAMDTAEEIALLYLPVGGHVELDGDVAEDAWTGVWIDPRTGARTPARTPDGYNFTAPDNRDWLLSLTQ